MEVFELINFGGVRQGEWDEWRVTVFRPPKHHAFNEKTLVNRIGWKNVDG